MENKPNLQIPYDEYKRLVVGASGSRMVYDIDLRKIYRTGVCAADAEQICREKQLFHRPVKMQLDTETGEFKPRLRMLAHETVVRRIADAIAERCRKLLTHRMSEDDLAMVRKLKQQCEDICLKPREEP